MFPRAAIACGRELVVDGDRIAWRLSVIFESSVVAFA